MFGFSERHAQTIESITNLDQKVEKLQLTFEEVLLTLKQLIDMQDPLTEVTKELNDTVMDHGRQINRMIDDLKGAAGIPKFVAKKDEVTIIPKRGGRPKRKI